MSPFSIPSELMNTNTPPLLDDLDKMRANLTAARTKLSSIRREIIETRESLIRLEHEETKLTKYIADQRTILNPVRRLPPDILFELFTTCLDSTPVLDLRSSRLSEDSLDIKSPRWVLGHVCSTWRAVVLSSPSLWSNIKLSITKKNSTFSTRTLLLGLHLQRTQQQLLSISLYGGYNSLSESHPFLVLLLPTAPRWNALFVAMKTGHIEQCLTPVKPFFERLNTLSLLPRSIHETVTTPSEGHPGNPGHPGAQGSLTRPERGIPDVFSTAPVLRKLQVFHDPTHVSIPWHRLTFLRLCPAVCRNVKVAGILKESQVLEELIIGCNLIQEEFDWGFPFGLGASLMLGGLAGLPGGGARSRSGSSTPSSFSITLPSLRRLILQSYQPRNMKNRRERGDGSRIQLHHQLTASAASSSSPPHDPSTTSATATTSSALTTSSFHHGPSTPTGFSMGVNGEHVGETGGAPQLFSFLVLPRLEAFLDYSKTDVPDWSCLREVFSRGATAAAASSTSTSASDLALPAGPGSFGGGPGSGLGQSMMWTITSLTTPTPTTEEDFLLLLRSAPLLERIELRGVKGLGNVGINEMVVPNTGVLGEEKEMREEPGPGKVLAPRLHTLVLHGDLSFDAKVFVDMVESRWIASSTSSPAMVAVKKLKKISLRWDPYSASVPMDLGAFDRFGAEMFRGRDGEGGERERLEFEFSV
ncbi:hypothetical protein VKT23_010016 [Stygiomarasmius scandens]|uniref:F-box domain-containing protein n=1 Tax=Marasmiellus scandens TaxID=2682957 RepID=A0ABR1JDN0_9AGAR